MSIRVLHIIGNLRSGGAQVCLKQIVENNDTQEIEHFIYPLRCKHMDIPIDGHIIKLPYPNYDPRKFYAIFSLCKKYDIDIIHAHLHKPIIGALLAAGSGGWLAGMFGMLAVAAAMVNVVGGYMVTDRMLGMFNRKKKG